MSVLQILQTPTSAQDEPFENAINHPRRSLSLFSPCIEKFDPRVDWLDGLSPAHPHFNDAGRIDEISRNLKEEFLEAALSGCKTLLERTPQADSLASLVNSLKSNPSIWKAVVCAQKYGVIYLMNRAEAKESLHTYLNERALADQINLFLQHDRNFHRVINYAIHFFINKETNKVIYPSKLIPPNAVSSLGHREYAIRQKDFAMQSSESMLDDTSVMWDLHDLAHQTTASLSPNLYGSKYFSDLQHLPSRATALIRSPGLRTAKGSLISDGLVFSELLTGLYTEEVNSVLAGLKRYTYASLERTLAEAVADYLLCKRSLLHPSTGKMLRLESRIAISQLAVLVQNKSYELTASEIEQRVFTRGGPEGDERDKLDGLNLAQRISTLAESQEWMYFEIRNTIKHRAHKTAYRIVAEQYREEHRKHSPEDLKLLEAIFATLDYRDWQDQGPLNLWKLIGELHCFKE